MNISDLTDDEVAAIPSFIIEEIDTFGKEISRLRKGEIPEEKFKRFRLQNGIYGQRQKEDFMVRVKIPQGTLDHKQMRLLADIGERFSNGIAHASSRQDIQFHYVKLENVPAIMKLLAGKGLTTREACGNTVRNVTACYLAGICPEESFDVSPYARLTTSYLLRNQVCQGLPRKFKIAFSGCAKDCALAPINDIGAIAVTKGVNGRKLNGFKIYIAGGLGPHPRVARLLVDFIPAEELIPLSEAILRVFDQYGERRNRSRARMKFLLEKIGFDELKKRIMDEFRVVMDSRKWDLSLPSGDTPPNYLGSLPDPTMVTGNGDPYFYTWYKTNVISQKQSGYSAVHIRLVLGDITTGQLRSLANITAKYAHGSMKVTQQQNFLMRWVLNKDVYPLYKELKELGLASAGAGRMTDIQSCPGAETCNLGLTSSRQLAAAIGKKFANNQDDQDAELEEIKIKVSGCPNSCGHHHIADIGFHGVAKKMDGRLVPHYQLHLGGGVGDGRAEIADSNIKLPAKNIPEAVSGLVSLYKTERSQGELFYQYVNRVGVDHIKGMLEKYLTVPSYTESPDSYRDWGSETEFIVKLGAGECAGGVVDLIEECLMSGAREASRASFLFEAGQFDESIRWIERAIISISKGMLVPFGIETEVEGEILREFQDKIIDKSIVSGRVEPLYTEYGKPSMRNKIGEMTELAKILAEESQDAYSKLDANFRFKTNKKVDQKEEDNKPMERKIDACLDLKGVSCPYNFVRTKLKLEEMDSGQLLQIIIDDGEPYQNVPKSVLNEGHKILEEEKVEDKHYRIVIEKA